MMTSAPGTPYDEMDRQSIALLLEDAQSLIQSLQTPGYNNGAGGSQPAGLSTMSSSNSLASQGSSRPGSPAPALQPQRLRLGSYNSEQGNAPSSSPASVGRVSPSSFAPRSSFHGLLEEADNAVIERDAAKAGHVTTDKTVFQGWVECRGRSHRFYAWKKRFMVWNSQLRKLSFYTSESQHKELTSYTVSDCNIHFRPEATKFWQRELRIDLAVTDDSRSPLSLNCYTKEAQTSWLRLFKRKGDQLDVTIDEDTRDKAITKFVEENKTNKTKYVTRTEAKKQVQTFSKLSVTTTEEMVRRSERPEWAKFLTKSKAHLSPLTVKETMKLFTAADAGLAHMVDSRKQHELNTFVSSCERDFMLERSLLNADVYPFLREVGKSLGVTVNLPIDLSFAPSHFKNTHAIEGVRNAEIKKCRQTSVGLSYVQLFGDRYGPNVLPTVIPHSAFDKIMCVMEDAGHLDEVVLFTKWYHLDENAVPAIYKLQPINSLIPDYMSSNKEKQQQAELEWQETVEKLEQSLSIASEGHMEENWRETYQTSELHSEFKQGLLQLPTTEAKGKCLVFVREFQNLDFNEIISLNYTDVREETTRDPETGTLVHLNFSSDAIRKKRLDNLKGRLSAAGVKVVKSTLGGPMDILKQNENNYLQQFLDTYCSEMISSMEKAAQTKERDPTPLEADVAAHISIAAEHQNYFFKAENAVNAAERVFEYLDDKKDTSPFYLHGVCGSGKSLLMSYVLGEIAKLKTEDSVVMVRFVGAGHSTSTGIELLSSLCEQIISIIGNMDPNFEPRELPHTFEDMAHTFPKILRLFSERKTNAILLIDGLDCLGMADVSDTRLLFSWLPTILPKYVKIIFSGDSEAKSHDALSSLAGGNEAKIDKWGIADVNKFIQEKLGFRGRTITPEQTSYVDKSIGGFATPLTAQLIMHEAASWPSYLTEKTLLKIPIRNSSAWLIDKMLDKCEKKFGEIVVRIIFGYLYCAMEGGLTTNELLDVLSLDDRLLNMLAKLLPPGCLKLQRRFPPVVWARICQDCVDILETRVTVDGTIVWAFAHSAINEAAGKRCQKIQKNLHANLANYFGGADSAGRYCDPQTLVDEIDGKPNLRKIMEYPYHLVKGEEWERLGLFLSNLNVLDVLGNRGSRRSSLRPGTGRSMLLELWSVWQKKVKGDICGVYLRSLEDWQKESSPSVRDSNRRMKAVAVFVKDYGKENGDMKCIRNAAVLLRRLLEREESEFGEDHPAVISTTRMLEGCDSLTGDGGGMVGRTKRAPSGGFRRGSVGLGFKEGVVGGGGGVGVTTPMKFKNPGGAENNLHNMTPKALEKQIFDESPMPISPIVKAPGSPEEARIVGGVGAGGGGGDLVDVGLDVTNSSWVASKLDHYNDIVKMESELTHDQVISQKEGQGTGEEV
ncbi:hypothetical protein TrLO_g4897 [Triparma laevis f. longispina]|uniref:PH domain-containing protein n=1 Tax=Triparma laevis f. longispina TaxID=1714387 RepID=A0A9W7KX72_9STRA|nr:hypothetical protein TrLO_g4897 [Triparma laevis f. longispina]